MRREEVFKTLKTHAEELEIQHQVKSLVLFGSVARGQAAGSSDVDLLVELYDPVGLFAFARLRRRLSEILGREVDLVTRGALRKEMRERILKEAIRAA
jgi:hypothetical protein